jgi:hypothetical protein
MTKSKEKKATTKNTKNTKQEEPRYLAKALPTFAVTANELAVGCENDFDRSVLVRLCKAAAIRRQSYEIATELHQIENNSQTPRPNDIAFFLAALLKFPGVQCKMAFGFGRDDARGLLKRLDAYGSDVSPVCADIREGLRQALAKKSRKTISCTVTRE